MGKVSFEFFHAIPGGGKGTQIEERKKDVPEAAVVYPGKTIRDAQQPGHPLHETIVPYSATTNRGTIAVPPEVIGPIVEREVAGHLDAGRATIIFDGVRYRDTQKRAVAVARRRGDEVDERHVLLKVPEPVARGRLQRASRGRQDDAAIDRRMEEHKMQTEPMLDELRREGKLCEVDGVGTVQSIRKRVRRCLE